MEAPEKIEASDLSKQLLLRSCWNFILAFLENDDDLSSSVVFAVIVAVRVEEQIKRNPEKARFGTQKVTLLSEIN